LLRKYIFIVVHLLLGSFFAAMTLIAVFKPGTRLAIGLCALIGFIGYISYMAGLFRLMDFWDKEDNNE